MEIRWYGQSAFTLNGAAQTIVIDPFGDLSAATGGRISFRYPAIEPHPADLLLVTHEHRDHNGVEAVTGEPHVVRSTAGTFDTPLGEVVAIASEHDDEAGTKRGPNTIFRFELDGLRMCHMGDFGQAALRPEQRTAIGEIDLLFIPVGGGPTIGAQQAAAIIRELRPAWVVPMHYRTQAIDFLEPPDAFLALHDDLARSGTDTVEVDAQARPDATRVLVPDAPAPISA
jgi:L-ascorbate metabolism protein UlaG (beta-lactamase superfamily)